MRKYIVKIAHSSQVELAVDPSRVTTKAIATMVQKQDTHIHDIDQHLKDLDRGAAQIERGQEDMRKQLEHMREQLRIMETTAPQAFDLSDQVNFTRPANVATSKEMVTIGEVTSAVKRWLSAAGFQDAQWK
eukprot:9187866-Pyramimonas_sp.AAC.1